MIDFQIGDEVVPNTNMLALAKVGRVRYIFQDEDGATVMRVVWPTDEGYPTHVYPHMIRKVKGE